MALKVVAKDWRVHSLQQMAVAGWRETEVTELKKNYCWHSQYRPVLVAAKFSQYSTKAFQKSLGDIQLS